MMFTVDGDIAFEGSGADAQRTIDVREAGERSRARSTRFIRCITRRRTRLRESHILLEMFYIYKKALPKECLSFGGDGVPLISRRRQRRLPLRVRSQRSSALSVKTVRRTVFTFASLGALAFESHILLQMFYIYKKALL